MENQRQNCSSSKHSNIDAVSYCQQCKIYLCNKCLNFHTELFDKHIIINLNKNSNKLFIDECKKENHQNSKLEFFCKTHNILCCSYCILKIKKNGRGEHFDCDFCDINDIKDEKKYFLKENINTLEYLSQSIEEIINEIKKIFEKINEDKDELKLKIQNIFTKIRSSLNEKEDKLLLEIDEKYNNGYINENKIKETEKLPKKIKLSLERGKIIEKDFNENNLCSVINDCINIENNLKEIKDMNDEINRLKSNKTKIGLNLEENKINNLLEDIKNMGNLIILEEEDLYSDFNIYSKKPIHILKNHTSRVLSLIIMNDGRLVSGSSDQSIIIYNKITYQPDIIIKEHNHNVLYLTQLSSGILASCSVDKTIKLFDINKNNYKILQTLNYHTDPVLKIIELKNKALVSCSFDSSIIFYIKDNLIYKKDYHFLTNDKCNSIIQIKDNEICYSETNNNKICFYDLIQRKIKHTISNINKFNDIETFLMITKDLLLIPGQNKISLININKYKIVKIIEVPNSDWIWSACMINKNMLLTGDSGTIKQWKIEENNLVFICEKEKAHDYWIYTLLNMRNGHIASGSYDNKIIIW